MLYSRIKKHKKKKIPKFDIGLAILRPILSFLVILSHYYNSKYADGTWKFVFDKTEGCYFHVRTFFIISLYFSYNTLVSPIISKKIGRLERLLIPYFIWPLIIFFLNKWIILFIKVKDYKRIELKDLIFQFICGHGFNYPLWFQFDLTLIFILFALIISLFRGHYNFILLLLGITSFIFQYNGKNLLYFNRFKDHRRDTFGRIIEIIPPSVTGFLIASSKVLTLLEKYRIKVVVVCSYIIYLLVNFKIFSYIDGFWHQGFKMYFLSICIFIIFSMFPSEKIKNERIIKIIKQIANHTAGVYYIHVPIYGYIKEYIMPIQRKTIKGCAILYLICYFICCIGRKIFGKTKLRNLFE